MLANVGPNLVRIIKEKNVGKKELAMLAGLPPGRIHSWCKGHRPRYNEDIIRVEKALNIPYGTLVAHKKPEKKDSPELLDELLNEFDMKKLIGIKMKVNQTNPSSESATRFKQDLLWVIDELHMRVSVND